MARSKSHRRSGSSARTPATANDPIRSLLGPSNYSSFASPSLLEVEDGRQWHPDPDPPVRTTSGNRTWGIVRVPRLIVHRRPVLARSYYTNIPVGLQLPVGIKRVGMFPVVTCVRRAIRKSVLFATRQTGKGSRSKRSPRSHVGC